MDLKETVREHEEEALEGVFEAKFDSFWFEALYLRRLAKLPMDSTENMMLGWLTALTASVMATHGVTKEEFLKIAGDAFDEADGVGENELDLEEIPEVLKNSQPS